MTNRQIVEAQKLLRKLEGEPVKVYNEHGECFWQVTYSNDSYNSLINIVEGVAKTPIKEYSSYPTAPTRPLTASVYPPTASAYSSVDYHREKID